LTVLNEEQLESIHQGSLRVLRDIGMKVLGDAAFDLYKAYGADVDPETRIVRFDPGLVEEAVSKAPKSYVLHARNPAHNVKIGDNFVAVTPVSSAPNVSDLDRGRRAGTFADFQDLVRLGQSFNCLHFFAGYPVEPTDLPVETRHLDCYQAFITQTDKAFRCYALSRERCLDGIQAASIALGKSLDELAEEPGIITLINTNSPLLLDGPMSDGIIELARHRQPVFVTPFTLCGAMAPITLAGALTQQNAEALAGLTLVQLTNPGAPCGYGGFTSNVDMRSGAPAFGTPEQFRATLAGGQLARRYGLPYRNSNVNASNAPDAQAAYESQMSLWSAILGGANVIHHGAGWLEGGLVASFEKMIIDVEMIQMAMESLQPISVNEETMGIAAMADVGAGGHFFGTAHTLARYESAFYQPLLSDWRNFETWQESGSQDAATRANEIWKKKLADYEKPPLDPAIEEELSAFVAKRKAEIAARGAD
jgi:trimethylamine--corrinoid protein Co-methyltransferase